MKLDLDLQTWKTDGEGEILWLGANEFEILVHTPFTLWCRTPLPADFEIAFDCNLQTPNAAMLLMACARDWRGGDFLQAKRRGDYDEYNAGALEMYTLGFNRTGNVSDEMQPNASTANLRRIGGPHFTQYQGLSLVNRNEAAMRRWQEWDCASLLASVREFASGTDRFFFYRARFHHPKITFALQDEELFTVVDHCAEPLRGGYVGLRCMTPGARYRVRNLRIADDVE